MAIDVALAVVFLVAASALLLTGGHIGNWSWVDAAILVPAYALASRIELDVGAGYTVPTQVVLVCMLLLLPPATVPLLVAATMVVAEVPSVVRGRLHPARLPVAGGDAIHALAPAAVLAIAAPHGVHLGAWPVYTAALVAQFALDAGVRTLRERLRLGLAPAGRLRALGLVYSIDALLAPLGLLAAYAARSAHLAYVLVLPILAIVAMIARERARWLESLAALDAAQADALTDELTGVVNRRGWNAKLGALLTEARRSQSPLTVAMLDLDHFKQFNDEHGHPAGDALLREVTGAWSGVVRRGDVLARVGGEEFALALPACPIDEAQRICERLRHVVSRGMTVSIGLARLSPGDEATDVQGRADEALYTAKREGRDRVETAPRRVTFADRNAGQRHAAVRDGTRG